MSRPKRQHFIPKSYLKAFADKVGEKYFVEVGNNETKEVKYPISINDICVSKNLYTLAGEGDEKYLVEKYYAEHIDGVYPEVYSILTDPKTHMITEDQRAKIMNVVISLYFRNARFLDEKNNAVDDLMDRLAENKNRTPEAQLTIRFGGRIYKCRADQLEETREQIKADNKEQFIFRHLEEWKQFVKMKHPSQITVNKIEGSVNLITGDNPVRIYNTQGDAFNIFDVSNAIQLPLDERHLLWISPNGSEWHQDRIYRQVRDKWFAVASNHSVGKFATDWVIGKKDSIKTYFEEMPSYDSFSPENLEELENLKIRTEKLTEFVKYVEHNGVLNPQSLKKFKELSEIPAIANDPQYKIFFKELFGK